MKLELVSFKLCPFVQRTVIVLMKQQMDYDIRYINLQNPPDWFAEISPTGQVPLLKVNGSVLFESMVISEFINDISPHDLHPDDDLTRATNRMWIEFASTMLGDLYQLATAPDAEKFAEMKQSLSEKLARVEAVKGAGKFFNGDDFCMIDAAFAPLFMRFSWINEFTERALDFSSLEKLSEWSAHLLADSTVQKSVVENIDDAYYSSIEARGGHLAGLLLP